MARLIWTPESRWWLHEIHEYISRDSPTAAEKVVDVKLPEGTRVTVVAGGPEQEVELSASAEEELLRAIREAERGDVVTAEDLLRRLGR